MKFSISTLVLGAAFIAGAHAQSSLPCNSQSPPSALLVRYERRSILPTPPPSTTPAITVPVLAIAHADSPDLPRPGVASSLSSEFSSLLPTSSSGASGSGVVPTGSVSDSGTGIVPTLSGTGTTSAPGTSGTSPAASDSGTSTGTSTDGAPSGSGSGNAATALHAKGEFGGVLGMGAALVGVVAGAVIAL
ncbi:hypothetical protein C8Q80DRAFT_1358907 [Daedaleopsis nitida]|nr:hypothetical protein C8Q80DRAFT_1358907 [Daedaleopsis nitida]